MRWLSVFLACACAANPIARQEGAITNGALDTGDVGVVALTSAGQDFCTGTLIAPEVVLTAAHCLDPGAGAPGCASTSVFFGADVTKPGTTIACADALIHPKYDRSALGTNDLALVLLAKPAPVPPVPYLERALGPGDLVGARIRIIGYGVTDPTSQTAGVKRQGATTITQVAGNDFQYGSSPSQTCAGDSGGPALMTVDGAERVVGVTSWGDDSCKSYGWDVSPGPYADFITQFISTKEPVQGSCGADGICLACTPADPDCAPAQSNEHLGELCATNADCGSGLCIDGADDPSIKYCSQTCGGDADCATGLDAQPMRCVETTDPQTRVCIYDGPSPGSVGWACTTGADCGGGICELVGGKNMCTKHCLAEGGGDCPLGTTCQDGPTDQNICLAAPAPSGCAVGHRGSIGGALVLLGLVSAMARRGRGRARAGSPARSRS